MTPEANAAKEYLGQVYKLNGKIKDIEDKIKELETKITNITPTYSDMPKSEHSGNSNERKLHKYIEEKIELECEKGKHEAEKAKLIKVFEAQIDLLEKEKYKQVLKCRFLDCLTWGEIAEKINYSDAYNTQHFSYRALKNFYEKILKCTL